MNSLIFSTLINEPEEINRILTEHTVDMDDLTSSLEVAIRRKYKEIENILKTELITRGEQELQNALKDAESDDDSDMMEILSECIDEKEKLAQKRKRALETIKYTQECEGEPCKKKQKIESSLSLIGEETVKDKETITFSSPSFPCEKYIKEELQELMQKSERVYEWSGPPAGCCSMHLGICPHAMLEKRVYKLPWSGVWIRESDLKHCLELGTTITVQSTKCSVGSYFGISTLHGQWGGFWKRGEDDFAIFVESGDSMPDDRELLYEIISIELSTHLPKD